MRVLRACLLHLGLLLLVGSSERPDGTSGDISSGVASGLLTATATTRAGAAAFPTALALSGDAQLPNGSFVGAEAATAAAAATVGAPTVDDAVHRILEKVGCNSTTPAHMPGALAELVPAALDLTACRSTAASLIFILPTRPRS